MTKFAYRRTILERKWKKNCWEKLKVNWCFTVKYIGLRKLKNSWYTQLQQGDYHFIACLTILMDSCINMEIWFNMPLFNYNIYHASCQNSFNWPLIYLQLAIYTIFLLHFCEIFFDLISDRNKIIYKKNKIKKKHDHVDE